MLSRPNAAMPFIPRGLAAIAIGGCALLFVLPLATRALTMADEGYLLMQALDMAQGKILYRDMDAFVTPGMWFLLAAVFQWFEPSVIASRYPVIVGYLVLIALAYRIPARVGGWRAGLFGVALMMMTTVWAFPAWTFAFYSPFSVLFALVGLDRLLAFHASDSRRDLVVASLFFGLSVLFKQNYGAFALIGAGLSLIAFRVGSCGRARPALRRAGFDILWMAGCVAAIACITIAYFAAHDALGVMFQSLVVHPFQFGGKHDIAYLGLERLFASDLMSESLEIMTYGAQPVYRTPMPGGIAHSLQLIERMHVLLYWFPPLIFIMGATLSLGGRREAQAAEAAPSPGSSNAPLLGILLVSFFVFLGTFPRADFNHLINVYQPVVIAGVSSFAVFFRDGSGRHRLVRFVTGAAIGLVLACYLLISVYWYYALIASMSMEVEGSRGGVKVAPPDASSLRRVLVNLDPFSEPGGALLTVPDIAMLNFLSKRPMPSAYYNLYEHHIAHDGGAAVVEGAEENGVTVAVTRLNNFFSDRVGLRDYAPVLTDYLDRYFEERYVIGREEYLLYTRRPSPAPKVEYASALENCRFDPTRTEVADHLLFRSMYQTLGPGLSTGDESLSARCTVDIPPSGGDLVWQFDYSHPAKLRTPTTLLVEVLVETKPRPLRVFSEETVVKPVSPRVSRFPAPEERRVDLSAFAGQRIQLRLRSTRSGRVVMSANAVRGFSTTWQDARIVARD